MRIFRRIYLENTRSIRLCSRIRQVNPKAYSLSRNEYSGRVQSVVTMDDLFKFIDPPQVNQQNQSLVTLRNYSRQISSSLSPVALRMSAMASPIDFRLRAMSRAFVCSPTAQPSARPCSRPSARPSACPCLTPLL